MAAGYRAQRSGSAAIFGSQFIFRGGLAGAAIAAAQASADLTVRAALAANATATGAGSGRFSTHVFSLMRMAISDAAMLEMSVAEDY